MAFHYLRMIHWSAPALMLSCFAAAILFSISHHVYYQAINAQPVQNDSEQRWVSRIGTGLAFIVKLLLTTSSATAFIQWFWYRLLTTPTTLQKTDVLYGMIYRPANLLHVKHWVTSLPLASLAIITWTIPLSALFTPGAILVQSRVLTSVEPITVQATNFSSGIYSAQPVEVHRLDEIRNSQVQWTNFNQMITKYMESRNSIMPVSHEDKNLNVSYHLEFPGPSISCKLADTTTTTNVNHGVRTAALYYDIGLKMVSFIPGAGFNDSSNTTFYDSIVAGPPIMPYMDTFSTDVSRIYVLFPDYKEDNNTLYSCEFYNTTYKIDFDLFTVGTQQVRVVTEKLNPLVFKNLSRDAVLDSSDQKVDAITRTYLGMASMYGGIATGHVFAHGDNSTGQVYSNVTPSWIMLFDDPAMLHDSYKTKPATFYDAWPQPQNQGSVVKVYEDMFKNITVSARFGFNRVNFDLPEEYFGHYLMDITTNATVSMSQTQYKYTPLDLLLPYGLSILFAFICIVMGVYAMLMSNASFSNDFSTVLRFVHSTSHLQLEDKKQVANPLPKHFKDIMLEYGGLSPHDLDGPVTEVIVKHKDLYSG